MTEGQVAVARTLLVKRLKHITGRQIAAARILLRWTAERLAQEARVDCHRKADRGGQRHIGQHSEVGTTGLGTKWHRLRRYDWR